MKYIPTQTSKDFYDFSKQKFPDVFKEIRFVRLFDHLLFSDFVDEDEPDFLVSPETLLADMEDMGHTLKGNSRNYGRASKFPKEFAEATGLKIERNDYFYSTGKAASYRLLNLPQDFLDALAEASKTIGFGEDVVCFDTGRKLSLREERERLRQWKEAKYAYNFDLPHDWGVTYLNDSSYSSTFLNRDFQGRLQKAQKAAKSLPGLKATRNLKTLARLFTFEPWYKADSDVERIYANGSSLQNLSESVRWAIVSPSKSYDLKAAQLAIMANVWDVSEVLNLFQTGEVWEEICWSLGVSPSRKSEVKPLIYSTAFGMSQNGLALKYGQLKKRIPGDAKVEEVDEATLDALFDELRDSRYIGPLLEGRSKALKRINERKGAVNPYGEIIPAQTFKSSWDNGKKGRTMLAYEMQTREKYLMEPVIEMARENPNEMNISLWLHDGAYVHYYKPDSKRAKALEQEMIRRVNQRAKDNGFPTELQLVQKSQK